MTTGSLGIYKGEGGQVYFFGRKRSEFIFLSAENKSVPFSSPFSKAERKQWIRERTHIEQVD